MKPWAILLCCAALVGCDREHRPGQVQDEARRAGRTVETMPPADEDYFHDMDGGVALGADEVKGRDTWLVWTGGNDRLWNWLAMTSEGTLDLLKTLSSHPALKNYSRDNRWEYSGLVNEPCYEKPTGPDPDRFGLWLDKRRDDGECKGGDPFENEDKYPGVRIGGRGKTVWRGKTLPVGSYYGYATGVVGLRLFPNPDFDDKAAAAWDPVRYYNDPTYYTSPTLVRPYRVGMACGFCHVGPNPVNPPADPDKPAWKNLSANVGAQYFRVGRVFAWQGDASVFLTQLLDAARPGTLDTSFTPTDGINNPRTMNAFYALGPRLQQAKRWGEETLTGGGVRQRQLAGFFAPPRTAWVPRILKDGADSVGALGALNRVYLNIGVFSEELLLHVNPVVGGRKQTPIEIAVARKQSTYWQATEAQTPNIASFFARVSTPHRLADALGSRYVRPPAAVLTRGKIVFAENCAQCHSSKLPQGTPLDPGGCAGPDYLACLDRYFRWTRTAAFKDEMRKIVLADDFLEGNFLSTDLRIPVTVLQTNACSPLATNAIAGNLWDNFSSNSYKTLPAVGAITVIDPVTGEARRYEMPGGGRGYTRPPSLISLWATAPFLLNNSVGHFEASPSVAARLKAFDDAIEKMLWPEKREKDKLLGNLGVGLIDRTTRPTTLHLSTGFLPGWARPFVGPLSRWFPEFGARPNGIDIGPLPPGTPINLIANVQLRSEDSNPLKQALHYWKVVRLFYTAMQPRNRSDPQAFRRLTERLLDLSKCPDFVVNRGHTFGASLSDADKRALIEFLKTF